jgi:hypothetical protein
MTSFVKVAVPNKKNYPIRRSAFGMIIPSANLISGKKLKTY